VLEWTPWLTGRAHSPLTEAIVDSKIIKMTPGLLFCDVIIFLAGSLRDCMMIIFAGAYIPIELELLPI
jgi:hypothetical protein